MRSTLSPLLLLTLLFAACGTDPALRSRRDQDTRSEEDSSLDTGTADATEGSGDAGGSGSDVIEDGSGDVADGSGSGDTSADTTVDTDPADTSADTTVDTDPADTSADTTADTTADTAGSGDTSADTTLDTDPADTTADTTLDTDPADTTADTALDTDPPDTTIPPGCGDGVVQSGEACDDGNTLSGDGCSLACAVELGYLCSGTPSSCVARCAGVICTGGDACNASSCNPSNGRCELSPRVDGTLCNDVNLCSTGDVCTAGVCGGREVVCPAGDGCSAATCNPSSGRCEGAPLPDCTACGAGNFCAGGVCGGVPTALNEAFGSASSLSRFTMSGTQPWTFDAAGGRTGGAMRSGVIGNSATSVATVTQTLTTAATFSFWYRVSSEASYDFLRVTLDGVNILSAAGTVGWTQVTRNVAAGAHTIVFTYSKDTSNAVGSDAAWVDDLAFSAGIGGSCASDGCGTSLFDGTSCVVCGVLPDGASCPGGSDCTEAICDAGRCTEATIPDGTLCGAGGSTCSPTVCTAGTCGEQAAADCTACGTDGLCGGGVCRGPNEIATYGFETEADAPAFVMGGTAGWTRTTTAAYAGSYSLRAGAIGSSQNSSATLTTTLSTAGELRFWVRASSEAGFDRLSLTINGSVDAATWSGTLPWTEVTRTLPAGNNTIVFAYTKDGSAVSGSDTVWIDQLTVGNGGGACGAGDGCGTPIWNGGACITCNPQPEGTVCEADAADCVIGTCRSGACAPSRAADGTVCDGDATDCRVGTCRTGLCNVVNATNGTICDSDTSDCQVGTCSTGSCTPAPVANGTSCDADSTDCTRDTCQSGACNAAPLADCTTCGADASGLCGAGSCQGGDGTTNGFESDRDLQGFTLTPFNPWTIDTSVSYAGGASLRSPTSSTGFSSTVEQTVQLTETTELSFWYKVSNALNYDYLYLYLDGNYYGYWTGEIPWTRYAVTLSPGTHTFQFYYFQSGSSFAGASAAWVDEVTRFSDSACASDECGRWVSGNAGCLLCEELQADCASCGTDSACMAGRCGGVDGVTYTQDFSSATRPAGFSVDTRPWVIDATGGRTGGAYASGLITSSNSSTSTFTFTAEGNATVTFWYKLNGYSGYDSFYAYLDSSAVISTSTPTSGWVQATVPVPPGSHALQFYFYNGFYTGTSGVDRAWVDDIRIVDSGGCASDACGLGLFDGTSCNVCPILADGTSCDADTTDCDGATCASGVCGTAQLPDCTSCGATGADLCIAGACGGLPAYPVINFDSAADLDNFLVSGAVSRTTATAGVQAGTGGLRLGPVSNYGGITASITVDTPADGTMTFWRRGGLAAGDTTSVQIDSFNVWQRFGAQPLWEFVTLPLTAGLHEITFYLSASVAAAPVPADRSAYFDTVTFSAYPSCPASNTCVYSGYDGAGCVACDTGLCGP